VQSAKKRNVSHKIGTRAIINARHLWNSHRFWLIFLGLDRLPANGHFIRFRRRRHQPIGTVIIQYPEQPRQNSPALGIVAPQEGAARPTAHAPDPEPERRRDPPGEVRAALELPSRGNGDEAPVVETHRRAHAVARVRPLLQRFGQEFEILVGGLAVEDLRVRQFPTTRLSPVVHGIVASLLGCGRIGGVLVVVFVIASRGHHGLVIHERRLIPRVLIPVVVQLVADPLHEGRGGRGREEARGGLDGRGRRRELVDRKIRQEERGRGHGEG